MKVISVKFVVSQARAPFEGFNAHYARENKSVGTKHFASLNDALDFGARNFRQAVLTSLQENYAEGETRLTDREIEDASWWAEALVMTPEGVTKTTPA